MRRIIILLGILPLYTCNKERKVKPVPIGFGAIETYTNFRKVEVGWKSIDDIVLCGSLYLPLAEGNHPVVIWHFGSTKWSRLDDNTEFIRRWLDAGLAVFSYDKRGVNKSQGECCPWQEDNYFPLLGQDVLHAAKKIAEHPEIRKDAIGIYGFSQGGWVVPVAAAESEGLIAFTIIGSGPTVTLGEELAYSQLTGESNCSPSELSKTEINAQLNVVGASLFDPVPFLKKMNQPSLWVYGSNDLSVPVERSTAILEELILKENKPFEYWVLPDANHSWIINGRICQTVGANFADPYDDIFDWILKQF